MEVKKNISKKRQSQAEFEKDRMRALIKPAHQRALYDLYLKLFSIYKLCPDLFPDMRLTTVFTAIMGSQPWGWRVVGISRNALKEYKKVQYKHPAHALHRGHIKMRANTAKKFLEKPDAPLSREKFFKAYLEGDKTLIMTVEENRSGKIPDDYVKIRNPRGELFRNASIGWRHGKVETEFLRALASSLKRKTSGNGGNRAR